MDTRTFIHGQVELSYHHLCLCSPFPGSSPPQQTVPPRQQHLTTPEETFVCLRGTPCCTYDGGKLARCTNISVKLAMNLRAWPSATQQLTDACTNAAETKMANKQSRCTCGGRSSAHSHRTLPSRSTSAGRCSATRGWSHRSRRCTSSQEVR